jgi:serine phosphatase RsbU (regulator of sigma subunit)/ligand-binding sensor domain-containing protein
LAPSAFSLFSYMRSSLAILVLLFPLICEAQVLPFTHYTADSDLNPLPSTEVTAITQDRQGFIWMGVYSSGLVRYDGTRMVVHGLEDGLRDVALWEIAEGADGRLWVGSNAGLVVSERPLDTYRNGARITFTPTLGGVDLLDVSIQHGRMAVDSEGRVWVGTGNQGIVRYRIDAGGAVTADTLEVIAGKAVRSVLARSDGSVWAALAGGDLIRFMPGANAFEVILTGEGSTTQSTSALFEDSSGRLWGGRQNGDIWRLDRGAGLAEPVLVSQAARANIVRIVTGPDGAIWAASEGGGVLRIPTYGSEQVVTRINGLLAEVAFDLLVDREENLWIAQSGGVSRLRRNFAAFENLTWRSMTGERPRLPSAAINAVQLPVSPGDPCSLWAATSEAGVACVGASETTSIGIDEGLPSNWVNGLAADRRGRLWIGTSRGINSVSFDNTSAANAYETREINLLGRNARLASYRSTSILAAVNLPLRDGNATQQIVESIWFPAYNHVFGLVGDEWFTLGSQSGVPSSVVHAAAFDSEGFLWIGTRDRGIYRSTLPVTLALLREHYTALETMREGPDSQPLFELFWNTDNGAPTNQIETLRWHDGVMWVGTPAGLLAMTRNREVVEHITRANGLRADNAVSISVSPMTGNLWIGTNEGLAEIETATRRVVRTVTRQDGLIDNEVYFYGSVLAGPDGTIYFGTARGLSIYRPQVDRPNTVPPLLQLSSVVLNNRSGGQNDFSFEYAALSFSNERLVRYRTRLVGYDSDWSPETADFKIRYTNLPAFLWSRTYTLEVVASNDSGVWNTEPLRYAFKVSPPWFLRWWTMSLYILVLGGLTYTLVVGMQRRVISREREKAVKREQALRVESAEALAEILRADNERKTTELERARTLQLSMLPKKLPQSRTAEVRAFMQTATEVGGDYYDFHQAADGTLTCAIGDATGHGAAAGAMVIAAKSTFNFFAGEARLVDILARSHDSIRRMGMSNMFMAMAVIRLRDHTVELAGAGLPAALLYRKATGDVEQVPLKGVPLGSPITVPHKSVQLDIAPGDTLLVMTDGFPELFNPLREMLGYGTTVDIFREVAHLGPDEILNHLSKTARSWASGEKEVHNGMHIEYDDDVTFVIIKMKAAPVEVVVDEERSVKVPENVRNGGQVVIEEV